MINRYRILILILFLLTILSTPAFSQINSNKPIPNQIRNGGVGVKIGVINTGIITIQSEKERELDPNASISLGVFFEFKFIPGLMISPALDFHNINIFGLNKFMVDFNILIKPIIYKHNAGLAIKPSFGVGIAQLAPWEIEGLKSSTTYLSAKANIELALFSLKKHAWILEVGYSAFPTGGNSKVDVKINPSLTVRIGVQY